MTWYQYALPVVLIAFAVRLEALFVGQYWAWIELVPGLGGKPRERRLALIRRVAIPGIVCFVLHQLWESVYDGWDFIIIGCSAGLLLLWPLVVSGLPWQVRARDATLLVLYGSLVVAFSSAAWLAGTISSWIDESYGSFWVFLREELASLVVGTVITAFALGAFDRAASRAGR